MLSKADKVIVRKNSAGSDFRRRRLNFIEGSNITITMSDDTTDNEIDLTIASSGGGGSFGDWKTIGSAGDYADVSAMITAGFFQGIFLEDITEGSDIAMPSGGVLRLDLQSYTLDMGDFDFTYTGTSHLFLYGNGQESGARVLWTHTTTGNQLCENASYTDSIVFSNGIKFDNNSTATFTEISRGREMLNNTIIECANVEGGGIFPQTAGSQYNNIEFVGGGTSCKSVITETAGVVIEMNNLYFSGTFAPTSASVNIADFGNMVVVNNITFNYGNADSQIRVSGATITNLKVDGAFNLDIQIDDTTNGAKLTSIDIVAGNVDLQGSQDNVFIGLTTTGIVDVTDVTASNNKWFGGSIGDIGTIGGDNNQWVGTDITSAITASAGADNNIFSSCNLPGGLTDTAGTTRVINCVGVNNHNQVFQDETKIITDTNGDVGLLVNNPVDSASSSKGILLTDAFDRELFYVQVYSTGAGSYTGTIYINDSIRCGNGVVASGSGLKTVFGGTLNIQYSGGPSNFSGTVGIGKYTPTAYLHIKAGTASASTAPIKLTSGVLNTTPEAGTIEFDGSDFYLTI